MDTTMKLKEIHFESETMEGLKRLVMLRPSGPSMPHHVEALVRGPRVAGGNEVVIAKLDYYIDGANANTHTAATDVAISIWGSWRHDATNTIRPKCESRNITRIWEYMREIGE